MKKTKFGKDGADLGPVPQKSDVETKVSGAVRIGLMMNRFEQRLTALELQMAAVGGNLNAIRTLLEHATGLKIPDADEEAPATTETAAPEANSDGTPIIL